MQTVEMLITAFFALMFILPVVIDFFRKLKKKQRDMGLERGPFDAEQTADQRTLDRMVDREDGEGREQRGTRGSRDGATEVAATPGAGGRQMSMAERIELARRRAAAGGGSVRQQAEAVGQAIQAQTAEVRQAARQQADDATEAARTQAARARDQQERAARRGDRVASSEHKRQQAQAQAEVESRRQEAQAHAAQQQERANAQARQRAEVARGKEVAAQRVRDKAQREARREGADRKAQASLVTPGVAGVATVAKLGRALTGAKVKLTPVGKLDRAAMRRALVMSEVLSPPVSQRRGDAGHSTM